MSPVRWLYSLPGLLIPLAAQAKTGPFPVFFGLYVVSLFVVIPAAALVLIVLIFMSWRRGTVSGKWVVAGIVAAAIPAGAIWVLTTTPRPIFTLSESTWPLIYVALLPVAGVWLAAKWRRARAVDGGTMPR